MPSHYVDYISAHKKAEKHQSVGAYADAILAYKRARGALGNEIAELASIQEDKILQHMSEACFVNLNILDCYRNLTPKNFLEYAEAILVCNKSVNEFAQQLQQFSDAHQEKGDPNRGLTQHSNGELIRVEEFLQRDEAVVAFIQSITNNMISTIIAKSKSSEAFQGYVTKELIPGLDSVEVGCMKLLDQLKQLPLVCAKDRAVKLDTTFVTAMAEMYENSADQLIDFYNANERNLALPFKEILLKTAYKCYKKCKTCMDSELVKTSYTSPALYERSYLAIISSLATTIDKFALINRDKDESLIMLIEVAEDLKKNKDRYKTLSPGQRLAYLNYQCSIEYRILTIEKQIRPDRVFSHRVSRVLGYAFDFSRKLKGVEQGFSVEAAEVMGFYNQIVSDFLLAKINNGNCNALIAETIINSILDHLSKDGLRVAFPIDKLWTLGNDGQCALRAIKESTVEPYKVLITFIERLLLQKEPTTLIEFSKIFGHIATIVASKGYVGSEIEKIFTSFIACMPRPQSPKLPSSSQPMAVLAAVPVPMSVEIIGDPPALQESKKRIAEEQVSGGTLPMFDLVRRAPSSVAAEEIAMPVGVGAVVTVLPPKKRWCAMAKEQEALIMQQLSLAQSTTVGGIQRPNSIPCFS